MARHPIHRELDELYVEGVVCNDALDTKVGIDKYCTGFIFRTESFIKRAKASGEMGKFNTDKLVFLALLSKKLKQEYTR